MRDAICQRIDEIEASEGIRIIHCAEAGSRAWGFASPDSDYDVRFVYIRPVDDYLRLDQLRDVIEYPQDGVLDINGWDLRKTLILLRKSNPTLFEWNNSPIIYKTTPLWKDFRPHINRYFLLKPGLYHYQSMAKSNYREYLKGKMVRLKKYLYVVRPLLACRWILEHHAPPPVLFDELCHATLEVEMSPVIEELLKHKQQQSESQLVPRIDALNIWVEHNLAVIDSAISELPSQEKPAWEHLNEFFLHTVRSI